MQPDPDHAILHIVKIIYIKIYFNLKEIPAAGFPARAEDYQFQTVLLRLSTPFPTFFCNHQHFASKSPAMKAILRKVKPREIQNYKFNYF